MSIIPADLIVCQRHMTQHLWPLLRIAETFIGWDSMSARQDPQSRYDGM
jgi:hypothetical protein